MDAIMPDVLTQVLVACGGGRSAVDDLIARTGIDQVARAVAREIESRSRLVDPPGHVSTRATLALTSGQEEWAEEVGDRSVPMSVVIHQDLADLVCSVYHDGRHVSRWLEWLDDSHTRPGYEVPGSGGAVADLLCCMEPCRESLRDLAVRFESDKWGLHYYSEVYERHLAGVRGEHLRVLEIGVGGFDHAPGGGSLLMWHQYLPRAQVVGLDIEAKDGSGYPDRVTLVRGDQSDARIMHDVTLEFGPFEIVIDDGSHRQDDILASFDLMHRLMPHGGLYVIEDLQTAYWPKFGGGLPDLTRDTAVNFLKFLLDAVHHEEFTATERCSEIGARVRGVHVYHNIAVIEFGPNREGSLPTWHPARAGGDVR